MLGLNLKHDFNKDGFYFNNAVRDVKIFLRRHILGYSVCLCPIKRTSGLYGLT